MSDTELTPGPAVDCQECDTISPMPEGNTEEECPLCGEYAEPVTIEACPAVDPGECADDSHHFGVGLHLVSAS